MLKHSGFFLAYTNFRNALGHYIQPLPDEEYAALGSSDTGKGVPKSVPIFADFPDMRDPL